MLRLIVFITILGFQPANEGRPALLQNMLTVGHLSDNHRITSEILKYDLQYRVYLPDGYSQLSGLPVIYVVDGQWYIGEGDMPGILDELIGRNKIAPLIAVFIDNRDPDNLKNNRRNSQFLCNEKYVQFVTQELVPFIDANFKTNKSADARAMLGLSFGGLNAAHFALKAHDTFHLIGMQSPELHPCPAIYDGFKNQEQLPLKIFMSTGAVNDTEEGTRRLKAILDAKGYRFKYLEVNEGHNWKNWKPLLDDILIYFFPA